MLYITIFKYYTVLCITMQTLKSQQKIIVEKQVTVEDFLRKRGLNANLYFISKDGKMMQDFKEELKIGDTVTVIARVAGG